MRNDPPIVTWTVETDRAGETTALKRWLVEQTDPGRTFVDEAVSYPGGKKLAVATEYRICDLFERISIDDTSRPGALVVSFHRRPSADGRWKDLMLAIIRSVEAKHAKVTMRRESLSA